MPNILSFFMSTVGGEAVNPALVLSVKTDNAGTSNDDQFTIPAVGGPYNVSYSGGSLSGVSDAQTITFPGGAGTYEISITSSATMQPLQFSNGGDKLKLLDLTSWGTIAWSSMINAFYGCSNLIISATDEATADLSNVLTLQNGFRDCSGLTSFPLIDTSNVTAIISTWLGCSGLTSFPLIDTSSAQTITNGWLNCSSLTSFPLIDTSLCTGFGGTWQGCIGLTSFPFLDVSLGTNFRQTFKSCTGLNGYDFPTLHLDKMDDGENMFQTVDLSTQSWSDLLVYVEANNTDLDCVWSGGNSTYNFAGGVARAALTGRTPGWTITDGGPE